MFLLGDTSLAGGERLVLLMGLAGDFLATGAEGCT